MHEFNYFQLDRERAVEYGHTKEACILEEEIKYLSEHQDVFESGSVILNLIEALEDQDANVMSFQKAFHTFFGKLQGLETAFRPCPGIGLATTSRIACAMDIIAQPPGYRLY